MVNLIECSETPLNSQFAVWSGDSREVGTEIFGEVWGRLGLGSRMSVRNCECFMGVGGGEVGSG